MELIKKLEIRDFGKFKRRVALYKCSLCGREVVRVFRKTRGYKNCGCRHSKFKHGESKTKIYNSWLAMMSRCYNSRNVAYKRYGGRGITVFEKWHDFLEFKKWSISNGFSEGLQIDRIDNDGDYTPYNCRWVTPAINSRNSPSTKLRIQDVEEIRKLYFEDGVDRKTLSEMFGVSTKNIHSIIHYINWK